jgi:hypothetical protein
MRIEESGEYIPADPHDTNIEISPETQQLIDDMQSLYERGELFIGGTGEVQYRPELNDLISKQLGSFVQDLKRYLGAEDQPDCHYEGAIFRINLWSRDIRWFSGGYTYWGRYDYVTQECRYMGRTRGRWDRR